jgi:hypothetical protein
MINVPSGLSLIPPQETNYWQDVQQDDGRKSFNPFNRSRSRALSVMLMMTNVAYSRYGV